MRVKLLDGVVFDLDLEVSEETMVDELKRMISEHNNGAPIDRQRVIFRGKVLKEGHTLREYGVSSDSTVHLVTRPDTATHPPQSEPAPQSESVAPASLGAGGVFMSTVNIGDGDTLPDFNDIVNRMLTSIPGALGAAAASTIPSSTSSQAMTTISAVDNVRQQLNYVAQALSVNEAVNDLTLSNDVPSVAQTTAQLRELCAALIASLNQVQGVLQRPSLATDPEARTAAERICGQLAQALGMLGPAVQQLGGILAQTRLGSSPGQEQVQLPSAGVTVAIHVPDSETGPAPSEPSASQPVNGQPDMTSHFSLNGPITLRARRTSARSASSTRGLSGNRAGSRTTTSNNVNQPSQNRPDFSAMLNSVASMLGGQMRSQSPNAPERSSAASNPLNSTRVPGARDSDAASFQRTPSQNGRSTGQPHPSGIPADFFQMLAPVVSSMLSSGGNNGSVTNLASFLPTGDTSSDSSNRFDAMLTRLMSRLQLMDLLAIFGGDWSCLESLNTEIRESLVESFMHGSDTPENRRQVVDEITDYLTAQVSDDIALSPVSSRIRPGVNIVALSRQILHPHVERLVSFILSDSNVFSSELKRLLTIAIGHWIDSAGTWFTDGTASVESLLKKLVQHRVESLGPELSMLSSFSSGVVATVLMHCRSQYLESAALEQASSGQEQWATELPLAVALEWQRTISADVVQQSNMPPQDPHSDSYTFGRDNNS